MCVSIQMFVEMVRSSLYIMCKKNSIVPLAVAHSVLFFYKE